MIHVREKWRGDFFLLAAGTHTVYQRHQDVGTYCSISHPWRLHRPLKFHHPTSMLWLGFRHTHAFIRVRLNTMDVVTPGETRADNQRAGWVEERRTAFEEAIATLELPIDASVEKQAVVLKPVDESIPFFCSWPDAFGPCQFEYNSSDAYEFLVPASKLAATFGTQAADVRTYLTGFRTSSEEFESVQTGAQYAYRCSVHCTLDELPELLGAIQPQGRLYSTLCEFQTQELLPNGADASAIVGIVGTARGFEMEFRLNCAPLREHEMEGWLERLLGIRSCVRRSRPFV